MLQSNSSRKRAAITSRASISTGSNMNSFPLISSQSEDVNDVYLLVFVSLRHLSSHHISGLR
jgi:hypothetical protein